MSSLFIGTNKLLEDDLSAVLQWMISTSRVSIVRREERGGEGGGAWLCFAGAGARNEGRMPIHCFNNENSTK